MRTLTVLFIAFVLVGCGGARAAKIAAKEAGYADQKAYYDVQAESYRAGTGGHVVGATIRSPALYQRGILINHREEPTVFHVSGQISVQETVDGNSTVEVELPPGLYRYRLYRVGEKRPYDEDQLFIDAQRGDFAYTGRSGRTEYKDWSLTAQ